jgi:hypothetical protein
MTLLEKIAFYEQPVDHSKLVSQKLENAETLGTRAARKVKNVAGSAATKLKGMSGKAKLLTGAAALASTSIVIAKGMKQEKHASVARILLENLAKK